MNKKSKPEQAEEKSAQGKQAAKGKQPRQSAPLKAAEGGAVRPEEAAFDFVGKVESFVVSSAAGSSSIEIALRGRHGARQTVRLNAGDSVMAAVIAAAHAGDLKVGVRLEAREDGAPVVAELACRPGLGKKG